MAKWQLRNQGRKKSTYLQQFLSDNSFLRCIWVQNNGWHNTSGWTSNGHNIRYPNGLFHGNVVYRYLHTGRGICLVKEEI